MSIKKVSGSILGLAVVVVGVWLGGSVYLGRTVTAAFKTQLAKSPNQGAVRMVNLQHQQGLLSSNGSFELRFNDLGADASTGVQALALQVEYRMVNLLLPASSMRFEWKVKPIGPAVAEINRLFGSEIVLDGKGAVGYGGGLVSSLSMPELVMRQGQDLMQISPSSGHVSWGKPAFTLEWKTDRITVRGEGQALDVRGVTAAADINNINRGTGTMLFGIDKLSTSDSSAEGLSLATTMSERADRIDIQVVPKIKSYNVAGQKLRDLELELNIKDLDASSIETISTVAQDSDDFQNLTADEKNRTRSAVQSMLAKGFSVLIPRLSGQLGEGTFTGDMQVEVKKSDVVPPVKFSVASRVAASGQWQAKGKAIDNTQKRLAVMLGIATLTPDGLKASFEFADGKLKANGRSYDLSGSLEVIDAEVNAFLTP